MFIQYARMLKGTIYITYLLSIVSMVNDFQMNHRDTNLLGKSFQQMVLEELHIHMQKNETGSLPQTTY